MKPREFIIFSACSMALLGLGIDVMLPAFGDLREHIGQNIGTFISEAIKTTLLPVIVSFMIIGLACLILIFSDRKFISQRT